MHVVRRPALTCLALLTVTAITTGARAETMLGEYFASMSPKDAVNSRGAPLNDICTIARQDRANYHRFGKRDDQDQGDVWFDDPAMRAAFGSVCVADPSYYARAGQKIRSGDRQYYIWVRVFGRGTQITRITIGEGAG
ncbi:hypothetical protein [Primorskyibacter sp. S187A]|uniref:hypothetical protein n=1 Tax=Primorskyibacter sp. S187A TaxID=3415130 RepID=UPI003C7BDF30